MTIERVCICLTTERACESLKHLTPRDRLSDVIGQLLVFVFDLISTEGVRDPSYTFKTSFCCWSQDAD